MKKALIIILAVLVVLVLAAIIVVNVVSADVTIDNDTEVIIEEGSGTAAIAQSLKDAGVIKNSTYFRIFTKSNGIDSSLKAGRYTFPAGEYSVKDVCDMLILGGVSTDGELTVTIPEGLTVKEIAELLAAKGLGTVENYLNYAAEGDFSEYDFIPAQGTERAPATRLEGFLFPDTYQMDPTWTEEEIFDMLLAQFVTVWESNGFDTQAQEQGKSVNEVITMASIVEKEAKVDADRPIIAGVFYNRLNLSTPMNLESCATIQFILGEPKEVLTYSDLNIDNPYNTYQNPGLPPGPIACPGKASIEAALNPTESDYLYFRAKTDGSHRFSETFDEHNKYHEGDQ